MLRWNLYPISVLNSNSSCNLCSQDQLIFFYHINRIDPPPKLEEIILRIFKVSFSHSWNLFINWEILMQWIKKSINQNGWHLRSFIAKVQIVISICHQFIRHLYSGNFESIRFQFLHIFSFVIMLHFLGESIWSAMQALMVSEQFHLPNFNQKAWGGRVWFSGTSQQYLNAGVVNKSCPWQNEDH